MRSIYMAGSKLGRVGKEESWKKGSVFQPLVDGEEQETSPQYNLVEIYHTLPEKKIEDFYRPQILFHVSM